MTLEQLVHRVESRLVDFGRLLLRPDPRSTLQEEIDGVCEELRKRHTTLVRSTEELEALRVRLARNQTASALLPSQIQGHLRRGEAEEAWRLALELDSARQALVEDRATLPRLEQTCWSLQFLVRQLERRLARLRDALPPRG